MTTFAEIATLIRASADADNLAGVIVHLNDTYLIEARAPRLPGMARVAGVIGEIRALVHQRLGADRTLVTHGGDYLGPSRLGKHFKGEAMTELLRHCSVDAATIGNHEFDYGWEVLKQRLREARGDAQLRGFATVLSNLVTSETASRALFATMLLWPPKTSMPFVAVFGFAGAQTVGAAQAGSFEPTHPDVDQWCDWVAQQVDKRRTVRVIVVLSHCSRDEDRVLQRALHAKLPRYLTYVLGGHDHHIGWAEPFGLTSTLLKCRSNGQTLAVAVLQKDALVASALGGIHFGDGDYRETTPREDGTESAILDTTFDRFRQQMSQQMPRHFKKELLDAFARSIVATYHDAPIKALVETSYVPEHELIEWSQRYVLDAQKNLNYQWIFEQDPDAPAADARAAQAVGRWLDKSMRNEDEERVVVADFTGSIGELDGTDNALRSRSTDFGNFVADAVKAGSGADLALINAGSLRGDDLVPAAITVGQLLDVLLYDSADATVLVEIARREARTLLAHGLSKLNHGAFLQVSDGFAAALDGPGDEPLKVALVRYMLASPHDEDGFCSVLAQPGESIGETQRRLLGTATATASLLASIQRGAARVRYSNARRVAADSISTDIEADRATFIRMVDAYRDRCAGIGVRPLDLYNHMGHPVLAEQLCDGLQGFLAFIAAGYRKGLGAKDRWFTDLYDALAAAEENYSHMRANERHPISYQQYLQECVELLNRSQPNAFFRYRSEGG
jgi:2',3'-cyclic-nucleotide 2'-phosphodiesterase (5'-nucleotidase family)